jgi:acetyl-CoA carboxylase biotin carboxyl carrier protein
MIDLEFLERLIRVFDDSGVDALEVERGGTRIKLSKTPPSAVGPVVVPREQGPGLSSAPPTPPPVAEARAPERPSGPASNLLEITSPMVGTFFRAPAPDAPPYVEPGRRVSPGDTICIIEAMKLMNELEAEISGTIVEVCVDNAQPVEFGQVLFRVDPR